MNPPLRLEGGGEVVERVALALHPVGWPRSDVTEGDREQMREEARRAIEAMREPTEAMVNAGPGRSDQSTEGSMYHGIWRAMIDAALNEGKA